MTGHRTWIPAVGLIAALVAATIAGGRKLEEQPRFCVSCHEMKDYYAQWVGSAANRHHPNCIVCHAGADIRGIVEGQMRGLGYIWTHYAGSPADRKPPFKAYMPNIFCTRCHAAPERMNAHRNVRIERRDCLVCHNHKPGRDFAGEAPIGQ